MNYRIVPNRWKLPIFLHNLRGYEGHLLIRAAKEKHGISESYPATWKGIWRLVLTKFTFSIHFNQSLDNLVGTLDEDDFMYTRQLFPDDEKFYLMTRKGVFPYDFFDNIKKFQYTSFPSREALFNTLSNQECSMKDYLNGKLVWNTFNCQSFRDYHDLYLKSDVILVADFFEKFRKMCMDSYGLDDPHYYTAPGMAWDAALKLTNGKLELFDNEDMYTFIERSIRGGISQISKRFAKANNKNCRDYDPLKHISHLKYLDANNLYGWAMSQYPNLYDKKNYVVHYRNLKFYLQQGLVITKIHRVLAFKQSPWLKTYIDFNTQMRAISPSTFAKDFYIIMNNSVFGKTQENLRNRVNVEVVTKRAVGVKRVCII